MNHPARPNAWYGWLPDLPDHRDLLYAAIAAPPKKLPPAVDLRSGCSAIENQGNLGSCTANALAGALEFLEKKAGRTPTDLSRLFIYYNERALEGTIAEDAGAMLRDGVKTLVKQGVCPEAQWPYQVRRFATKPPVACYRHALDHQLISYHRIRSLAEMRSCLAEGYPFVFGFTVYEAFESAAVAKTGRLDLPRKTERALGGHAVMAVGYDDRAKRLTVRNSWGADWGLRGCFTMPYDYAANSDLADDFWTLRVMENP